MLDGKKADKFTLGDLGYNPAFLELFKNGKIEL